MHFGENQLSPRSLGISPLPTAHPSILQPSMGSGLHVRVTGRFTLAMGSSPGFGSTPCHSYALSDSLSLRLRPVPALTSPPRSNSSAHSSIGTPSPACTCSDCLEAHGFRIFSLPLPGCFSPFPHGTGSLSVVSEYLALEGGPPSFPRDSTCSAVLRCLVTAARYRFAYGTLTRSGRPSQIVRLRPRAASEAAVDHLHQVLQPPIRNADRLDTAQGLGSSPFAHHYLGNLG